MSRCSNLVSIVLGLGVLAVDVSAGPSPTPRAPSTQASARKAVVRYDAPRNPDLVVYADLLKSGRMLESVADSINSQFRLPAQLQLVAAQCDVVNAFYDPTRRTITLCYEYVANFDALQVDALEGQEGADDQDEIDRSLFGATEFVLLHEVGHALIHLLDLPVVGREEEAADQLAAVMLIEEGDDAATAVALDGAYTFILQAAAAEAADDDRSSMADEHALDEQRYYNVTCWIYGSDPEVFVDLVGDGVLPEARAARCPNEWKQASSAWSRLLDPHRVAATQP